MNLETISGTICLATINPVAQGRQFKVVEAGRVDKIWHHTVKNDRGEYKEMTHAEYCKFFKDESV